MPGSAHQNRAMAPEMWGVAMEVPLAVVYALSLVLEHERVPVPGAAISGLMRLLPSAVTGPVPVIVLLVIVMIPGELNMAPPSPNEFVSPDAVLLLRVEPTIVTMPPALLTPPPLSKLPLFVIVLLVMLLAATPP